MSRSAPRELASCRIPHAADSGRVSLPAPARGYVLFHGRSVTGRPAGRFRNREGVKAYISYHSVAIQYSSLSAQKQSKRSI